MGTFYNREQFCGLSMALTLVCEMAWLRSLDFWCFLLILKKSLSKYFLLVFF